MNWPAWWEWEIETTPHVLKRMVQRDFTEVDLRQMMTNATGYYQSTDPERWVIETRHRSRGWELVVEPDHGEEILVVVTAYPT